MPRRAVQSIDKSNRESAFTLVELLVVVSIIALLISILLPSLKRAREQTKEVVCLSNSRSLGIGVQTYATEYSGVLPGPVHPALYREQTLDSYMNSDIGGNLPESTARQLRDRQLSYMLATSMGQKSDGGRGNVSDLVAECPSLTKALSREHFKNFYDATGRQVFPFHKAINNYGTTSADPGTGSFSGTPRFTNPPNYFGLSPHLGATFSAIEPQSISRIKRTSEEWMIADAWHRGRANPSFLPQQEGPYQSGWSGDVLPWMPAHRTKGGVRVTTNISTRSSMASSFSNARDDGVTNTVFFDGHAAPVQSKTLGKAGFTVLYGFPGTVNPDLRNLSVQQRQQYLSLEWR